MAHHPSPVTEDPEELARAVDMWERFIEISKWSIVVTAGILLALAAAFVTF